MNEQQEQWQKADSEKAYLRCIELVQIAARGKPFELQDIEDLIYFLGLKEYFK